MELKYVGPKPIISHTGIEFDKNKEDKYLFLSITVQLIKALSHDYFENRIYSYNADTKRASSDELHTELKRICPNLDELIERKNHDIEDEIQHNIDRANESYTLNKEEKDVLKNNIEMMHDYLIQRSVNKAVYYCAINALAELVKKDHIDYIVVPMYNTFTHVLHSVQGVLQKQKCPIDTELEIYKKDGTLFTKLKVVNAS